MQARRICFLYLGRRGALSRLTMQAIQAARSLPEIEASVIVSAQNEAAQSFRSLGPDALLIDTFQNGAGALLGAWRLPALRRRLGDVLRRRRIELVVELMPHVWSAFLVGAIRGAGAAYVTVVHDADPHPGDRTGLAHGLLLRAAARADRVVTLSGAVAARLAATGRVPAERMTTLFLPDLHYGAAPPRVRPAGEPLRALFFGRIMPYKGLSTFVDALQHLADGGVAIQAGVIGEGPLGSAAARLEALGVEVVNRWIPEEEIAGVLARYDVLVVTHVEASQSGVVATAFGAGLPVVASPVGGLVEQVEDGVTGLLLPAVSAEALAAALRRLVDEPGLLATLRGGVAAGADRRSMARFVGACSTLAGPARAA